MTNEKKEPLSAKEFFQKAGSFLALGTVGVMFLYGMSSGASEKAAASVASYVTGKDVRSSRL